MHTTQRFQVTVVKTLHTNGQAGDAGLSKGLESVFFEGTGIGLHGDLSVRGQAHTGANAPHQTVYRFGRKQAGRAPA